MVNLPTREELEGDLSLQLATRAHAGTSWVPEQRGASVRREYAETLMADLEALGRLATTPEKQAVLEAEFARYREGYKGRVEAWLSARGRVLSPMIAGPANFPGRRNEKANNAEHARLTELLEYRERALNAIRKALTPELAPIMAGDSDAAERLAEKIGKAEAEQARMKAVNAAHAAFLKDPASLDASGLSDADKARVRNYKPEYSWEPHPFAPFQLTNNGANIRRMKERLAVVEKAQATPETVKESGALRMEDSPADNRVRLFFPGKPDEATRSRLKSHGFRWAPSLGCWQGYRNNRTLPLASAMLAEAAAIPQGA